MFGLGFIPASILFIGMLFVPNSPRWLAMKGETEKAREVLRRVRPTDAQADQELEEIIDAHDQKAPFRQIFEPWVRPCAFGFCRNRAALSAHRHKCRHVLCNRRSSLKPGLVISMRCLCRLRWVWP